MFHNGGWYARLQYDEGQDRPLADRALLRRVFSYGRPYRAALVGVLVTILVISSLSVVPALLVKELLDVAIPTKNLTLLTQLGIGMVAVPLVNALLGVAQRWLSSKAGEGIIFDLRSELYAKLKGMSLRFYTATKTGELISRLNNDVVGAQSAITGTFITITSNIVSVVVILSVMIRSEWRLTLLAIAALPLFVLPARQVAKVLRRIAEQQMEHNASMSAILQETFNVSGALLVKLFNRGAIEQQKFENEAGAVRDLGIRRALVGRWFFAALGLVSAIGTASVFWVGGWLVITSDFQIGVLVMFSQLTAQLYGPLSALSNARVEFATSLVSFERVFEVVDLPVDIPEAENPIQMDEISGEISFDHVYFRYATGEPEGLAQVKRFSHSGMDTVTETSTTAESREWALEDVTFTVAPGEMVALVGPSGAGKTTVSYLVPRLYDINEGAVRVDGHDVRDIALGALAEGVGIVTQESYLFHDTIAENLRYAKGDATLQELEDACRSANIHEFVSSLSDSYDTVVGERGYRLSGGDCSRHSQRSSHLDPRRSHVTFGLSVRGSYSECSRDGDAGENLCGDCPSIVDHSGRRQDSRARSGQACGTGNS